MPRELPGFSLVRGNGDLKKKYPVSKQRHSSTPSDLH